jgi:hypothetical protein
MVKRNDSKRQSINLFLFLSVEPEQSASYYENINQLLKVFIQHPFIFNSPESLELLCNLLKQRVLELGLYNTLNYSNKKNKLILFFVLSSYTFTYD